MRTEVLILRDRLEKIKYAKELEIKKYGKSFNIMGIAKLLLVLICVALIYFSFSSTFAFPITLLCVASIAALILLWLHHNTVYERLSRSKGILDIVSRHIKRLSGEWTGFEDNGSELSDYDHPYSGDLDIVGSKSFFQFLNTTSTWHGRRAFASDLLDPSYNISELKARQGAIAELSKDIDFANDIEYCLSQIGVDSSADRLVEHLSDNTAFIKNRAAKIIISCLPATTLVFIMAALLFGQTSLYSACAVIVVLQVLAWIVGWNKTHKYTGAILHVSYKLGAYGAAIEKLCAKEHSSEKLVRINTELSGADKAFKELGGIADMIRVNHNGILYLALNVFLLWDYQCAFAMQEWKNKYAGHAEKWFKTLGEFESLLCLSHLPLVCNGTSMPLFSHSDGIIHTENLGHPLISNKSRVSNSFNMDEEILIVSGSNMSGKTTFLRTVGINLVLAKSGGYVCASHMLCSLFNVSTSMRIADDLSEGVSTFYAEIKRIKSILDLAGENTGTIFLIDEIFNGTNSVDRLEGAKTVISKLSELGASGLITTHDLELCNLENENKKVSNYSFSEYYTDNDIHFDYTLRNGKSKTTNAKVLMKMIGIN